MELELEPGGGLLGHLAVLWLVPWEMKCQVKRAWGRPVQPALPPSPPSLLLGLGFTHMFTAARDQSSVNDVFALSSKQTGVSMEPRETFGGRSP